MKACRRSAGVAAIGPLSVVLKMGNEIAHDLHDELTDVGWAML